MHVYICGLMCQIAKTNASVYTHLCVFLSDISTIYIYIYIYIYSGKMQNRQWTIYIYIYI